MFKADVLVNFKEGVLDPQAKAISGVLSHLGYDAITNLRVGKHFVFNVDAGDRDKAYAIVDEVAKRVLSNPVLETYTIELKRDDED